MSETARLGRILNPGTVERDAIHVAIIPVQAPTTLTPGQHVDQRGEPTAPYVGIVDPFLKQMVLPNQWFYLCLYPGTVISLRHQWRHPAFPDTEGSATEQVDSEEWLRCYAIKMNPYLKDPNDAFNALIVGLKNKELFAKGTDLHGLYELDDADNLKMHAERYLGIKINWSTFEFTCSC